MCQGGFQNCSRSTRALEGGGKEADARNVQWGNTSSSTYGKCFGRRPKVLTEMTLDDNVNKVNER